MNEETRFEQWAVIELMGHARAAGLLQEVNIAGAGFLRLDIPGPDGETLHTKFLSPGSVYSINPVEKAVAVAVAQRIYDAPVKQWEIEEIQQPALAAPGAGYYDEDEVEECACDVCNCSMPSPFGGPCEDCKAGAHQG